MGKKILAMLSIIFMLLALRYEFEVIELSMIFIALSVTCGFFYFNYDIIEKFLKEDD